MMAFPVEDFRVEQAAIPLRQQSEADVVLAVPDLPRMSTTCVPVPLGWRRQKPRVADEQGDGPLMPARPCGDLWCGNGPR